MGWRNNNLDISIWDKNLTDETYLAASVGNSQAAPFIIIDPASSLNNTRWLNEPRSVGLSLIYSL